MSRRRLAASLAAVVLIAALGLALALTLAAGESTAGPTR